MSNSDLLDAVRAYVAAIAPGHAPTWISIELDNDRARVVSLPVTPGAPPARHHGATGAPPDDFVCTPLQDLILDVLAGKALRTDQLVRACDCDRSQLFRKGGLKDLREAGLVSHHPRAGFFRPDDPPPELPTR